MIARRLMPIAIVCAMFAPTSISADENRLAQSLNHAQLALQNAFRDDDPAKIRSMFTADHQAVTPYYGTFVSTEEQLRTLSEFDFTYRIVTEPQVDVLSETVALITYESTYDGTFQDKPMPKRVAITEVWVKEGERWLQRLYQETAAD